MKNEKSLFFKIVTTIFLFVVGIVFSQNTSTVMNVDSSYDFGTGVFSKGSVSKSAMQSDGKIVIYGNFDLYGTTARTSLARINSDGTIDQSFSVGTGFPMTAFLRSIKIDSNGKILIAGSFNTFNGTSVNNLIRLNTDGSLDTSFALGTGPNQNVNAIALQPDGKILIAGDFNSVNGTSRTNIARLEDNGAVDTSFVPSTFSANGMISVKSLKVLSDGKIYAGGTFGGYGGLNSNNIVRINPNGSIDNSFNAFSSIVTEVSAIEVDPTHGTVFLGGGSATYNGTFKGGLISLDNTGLVDINFNASGSAFGMGSGNISDFFRLSDGKLLCIGMFNSYNSEGRPGIAIVNPDGSLNAAFSGITGMTGQINTGVPLGNGSFLLGGSVSDINGTSVSGLLKMDSSNVIDASFSSQVSLFSKASISTPAKQSDDKVIVTGGFTLVNGTSKNYLVRLDTNGSVDNTFNNGGTGLNGSASALYVQPDDKIILAGYFTNYNGTSAPGILRLNPNGSIDTTFNAVGTGFPMGGGSVFSVFTQADGKILVGGTGFTTYNGTAINRKGLIRLNSDGSLDTTFNSSGTGVNTGSSIGVYAIKQQTDGKNLIAGNFTTFNGSTVNGFARIDLDGAIDNTFAPTSGGFNTNAAPRFITIQPNGKIVVTGTFTSYETVSRTNIVRINDNGSLDTSFTPGAGPSGGIAYAPVIMSDGKLLLPGSYTSYNGTAINRLARLNTDGTLDTSFSPGSTGAQGYFYLFGQAATSNRITAIFPLADGKFLASGNFTSYNGVAKNMFVKLEAVVTNNLSTLESSKKKWFIYPNPAKDFVNISNFNKGAQISLYDMTGRLLFSTKALSATVTIDTSAYQSGVYVLKVDGQSSKLLISK